MVYLLQIEADSLATLGLFTYLGRRTRIFLSAMGIKDLDGVIMNFLRLISLLVCYILTIPIFNIPILKIQCFDFSYLECGILFVYPEFSSIRVYQCFMEVSFC